MDIYFQPLVLQGRSYLKDRELIKLWSTLEISANNLLVTVDVESLYTNIKQTDSLKAVGH